MKLASLIRAALLVPLVSSRFTVHEDIFSFPKFEIKYNYTDPITKEEALQIIQVPSQDKSYELLATQSSEFLCAFHKNNFKLDDQQKQLDIDQINTTETLHEISRIVSESLDGQCFNHKEAYWKYNYCHKGELLQSHANLRYILGKFNNSDPEPLLKLAQESGIWMLSYVLTDGTICDLTGESRTTELQYVCNPETEGLEHQLKINWVHEYKTCGYAVQVHVPELCQFDLFKEQKFMNIINCQKVIGLEDFEKSLDARNKKINIVDYNLEKVGRSLYIGHPTSVNDKLFILIDTLGTDDLIERFGVTFYQSLKYGKFITDPSDFFATEFRLQSYVYNKYGDYITTLTAEQNIINGKASVVTTAGSDDTAIDHNFSLTTEFNEESPVEEHTEPKDEEEHEIIFEEPYEQPESRQHVLKASEAQKHEHDEL